MSELEERISSVLSDPAQMAQLRAMAQSLMGGAQAAQEAPVSPPPGIDLSSPGKLGALLGGAGGEKSRQLAALEALAPCLSDRRREKLTHAIRLARMLRLAGAALQSEGGEHV